MSLSHAFLLLFRRRRAADTTNPKITALPQSLPPATIGVSYAGQLTYSGGTAPVQWALTGGDLHGIGLHADGSISGSPNLAGIATFNATVSDSRLEIDSEAYTITVYTQVAINSGIMPQGVIGQSYSYQFSASGGRPPYTFTQEDTRPQGTTLQSDGTLSGVISAVESITMTVRVRDADLRTTTGTFNFVSTDSLGITTTSLPQARFGTPYTAQITVLGGIAPLAYSMSGNPGWLTINPLTGALTGNPPNTNVTSSITFTVSDAFTSTNVTLSLIAITAAAAVDITTTSLAYGTVGVPYSQTIAYTGGFGTLIWSTSVGPPPGLQLTGNVLSGTPTSASDSPITIIVYDPATGATDFQSYVFGCRNPVSAIPQTFPSQATGTAFNPTFTASGGDGNYTFALTSGVLPPPKTFNTNGTLSGGTLTTVGPNTWGITPTDSQGRVGQELAYTLTVTTGSTLLNITTTSLPNGVVGGAPGTYGPYNIVAVGGVLPFTWSDTSNSFQVSGTGQSCSITNAATINSPFTFNVQVTVTDSSVPAQTDTQPVTITITASSLTISPSTLQAAIQGTAYNQALSTSGGTPPYSYVVFTGPTGMTTVGATINWPSPTTVGSPHTVRVDVTDANSVTGTRTFSGGLTVNSNALQIPAITPPTATENTPYTFTISAAGGTAPYSGWAITVGALPTWARIATVNQQGVITGTPQIGDAATIGPFTVRVTDAAAATATRQFSITTVAAAAVTGDDWPYRTSLAGTVLAEKFDTSTSVSDYMFNDPSNQNHPFGTGPNNWSQWVGASHPDANVRKFSGTPYVRPGCMRITVAGSGGYPVGHQGTQDQAVSWLRRLNSSWGTADAGEWMSGYREGDEFWVYVSMKLPQFFVESHWFGDGGVGWKTMLIDSWNQTNSPHEQAITNSDYRDYIHGYGRGGAEYDHWEILFKQDDYRQERAVDHQSGATHPGNFPVYMGINPNTGGTTGIPTEQDRKRYGGLYHYAYLEPSIDGLSPWESRPRNSDPISGAMMWRRDCQDRWIGILHHIKIVTWDQPVNIVEVWAHKEGGDYLKIHTRNDAAFGRYTDTTSNSYFCPAYQNVPSLNPAGALQGTHGFSGVWLLLYMTGRWVYSNNHPDSAGGTRDAYGYYGEVITREGVAGIPAPNRLNPPVSDYTIPSFVPAAVVGSGNVVRLSSVSNGRPTLYDVIPAEWQTYQQAFLGGTNDGRDIFRPWTGGAWDYDKRVVYFPGGGGHTSTTNNMTAMYDFNGSSQAAGFRYIDGSTVAVAGTALPTSLHTDGKWPSLHTYGGMCVSSNGKIFRYSGSPYQGGGINTLWSFDPATKTYIDHGAGGLGANFDGVENTLYDSFFNKVLVLNPASSQYAVFDPLTMTFSTGATGFNSLLFSGSGGGRGTWVLVDATRTTPSRIICMGAVVPACKTFTFNGSTCTQPAIDWTPTGSHLMNNGTSITRAYAPSLAYDPELNCVWIMDLSDIDPTNRQWLFRMDLTLSGSNQFTFTRYPLVGTAISQTATGTWNNLPKGSYKRMGVLRGWNSIGLSNRADDGMYLIRKPA